MNVRLATVAHFVRDNASLKVPKGPSRDLILEYGSRQLLIEPCIYTIFLDLWFVWEHSSVVRAGDS